MENEDKDLLNQEQEQQEEEQEEITPPTRNASYYYQKRQEEKAQREAGYDDSEIDSLVEKKLEERLGHMTESFDKTVRQQEIKSFLAENPEFKGQEKKIETWWNHPSRRQLPLETVALEALGKKELARIYAEQALNQDREARQTRVGGSTVRREGGAPTLTPEKIATMSDKDLDAAIRSHT